MTRAAWLLVVLFLGCPPPTPIEDGGVDASVPIGSVELCQRFASATCALRVRCFPAFTRLSFEECQSQTQAACLAEYESYGRGFRVDGVQLDRCERRLRSSACPASFPPSRVADVTTPFSDCTLSTGLLRGAAPSGSTCDVAVECEPGTFCVRANGVCRGTCASLSNEGEPCGIGCTNGLRCENDRCVALKTLDEACARSSECEDDLLCLGTCRPRRKLGESCAVDVDRLGPCEPGLACDVTPFVTGATGTCIAPRGLFETCRFHWSCQPGLVCADMDWTYFPGSAPLPGFCREPDGDGNNCVQTIYASYVGDSCAPGLTCRENACRSLPVRGDPCTPSKQNCSGFEVVCKPTGSGDFGICASTPTVGERCAVRIDASRVIAVPCANGYCDVDVTQQCRGPSKTTGARCEVNGECISGRCVPQSDMTLRCAPAC
ncbi:MAG: hypothetical protein ACO1OB_02125 [Archangium sp.]